MTRREKVEAVLTKHQLVTYEEKANAYLTMHRTQLIADLLTALEPEREELRQLLAQFYYQESKHQEGALERATDRICAWARGEGEATPPAQPQRTDLEAMFARFEQHLHGGMQHNLNLFVDCAACQPRPAP